MKDRLKQRRGCVYSVIHDGQSVEETAALNRFDVAELQRWVDLYQEHGEVIFAPDAEEQLAVELFRLKYPEGKPKTGLRHALRETLLASKRALFHVLFSLPVGATFLAWAIVLISNDGPRAVSLSEPLFAGGVVLVVGLLASLILFTLESGERAAKGKLREISYSRTKRDVVDKQETVGGVSLATDEPDAHGALAIADHDVGELMLLDHDQEQRPVTAPHGASAKPGSGLT